MGYVPPQGSAKGAGATTFVGLTDTPSSYSGSGGKGVKVKTAEDGLEFVGIPRTATLVVAASDSKNTTDADKTCDGSADETEINAAIGELP